MNKDFSKLCTPAKIYFVIAVLAAIVALFNGITILAVFVKLIFAFIWTFILSWLCDKGFKTLSWFLVLLPYIIIALAIFGIYRVSHEQKQLMRNIQLQGAYGEEAMTMPKVTVNKKK
jgi:predicted lysophospholipase L1 biosynthesis ABC-type transport system permease subunit